MTILVCALLGVNFFAESIYRQNTEKTIKNEIRLIELIIQDADVDAVTAQIDTSAFRLGGTVSLYDEGGGLVYSSIELKQGFGHGKGHGKYVSGYEIDIEEHLVSTETNSGQIMLYYKITLASGGVCLVQLPEEKLTDALLVFQQLLLYVAIIALIVAFVGSVFMSNHFSQPIVELKLLAEQIATLDFSGRYEGKRDDEIDALGKSLNRLSGELQLTIEQLQRELDKEKTLDILRTQFVAQASHELQTPLTVLRNYIEVMEDEMISNEELPDHLAVMRDEVDAMSELVSGMLDLSQLRSGKFNVTMERINISALLQLEEMLLKERAKKLTIEIESDISSQVCYVIGDPKRLRQVIRNLYENALKHSNGKVVVRAISYNGLYRVSIENTGQQISESELHVLWNAFYKEDGNHKKGTGLGLAISKEILEQHQATYGIENYEEGVRSYFELELVD